MKRIPFGLFIVALAVATCGLVAQAEEVKPGVARWPIKTSIITHAPRHDVGFADFLALPGPPGARHGNADFQAARYPRGPVENPLGLAEGDIITIRGWLHLAAAEPDGDYHIQISANPTDGDHCIVIEVPLDDARFTGDAAVRTAARRVREFVRTRLLRGKEPSRNGSVMMQAAFVEVTGQLFFDDAHVGDGKPRGKKGMRAATLWELHPITAIRFAPKPH